MKTLLTFLILSISINSHAVCDLEFPTKWIEQDNLKESNKLELKVTNDRNIYIKYNLFDGASIDLAHKIYVCTGKRLSVVTEDDTVEMFAYIETLSRDSINLHFVKGDKLLGIVNFKKI